MRKTFTIIILFFVFIFFGCSCLKVATVKECNPVKGNSGFYFLPRTVFKIEIEVTKRTTQKGPYSDFAEKYLGIKNVQDNDNIEYFISGINIFTFAEPDSNRLYIVKTGKKSILDKINLRNDGLLLSVNGRIKGNPVSAGNTGFNNISSDEGKMSVYYNMSIKKYFSNKTDTSFKLVKRDSLFVNVPVLNNKIINKSFADKAEEMANAILNIREERLSLLSGDNNSFPDGGATKQIFEEFDKLENEYLSLFTGKTSETLIKKTFYFVPDKENSGKMNTLTFFSKKSGLSGTNLSGSNPISIIIDQQGLTNSIQNFNNSSKKKNFDGLFYIIPDLALIRIFEDKEAIYNEKIMIPQLGTVNLLPEKILKKKNVRILFYPELGSLKSIDY